MKKLTMLFLIGVLFLAGCGGKPSSNNAEGDSEKPASEQAETKVNLDFYEWEASDEGIKILNYKGNEERVVVPSIIDNKMVTSMDKGAFNGNVAMKEFIASEYMESASGRFDNCLNLVYIEFPGALSLGDLRSDSCETLNLPCVYWLNQNQIIDIKNYMTGLKEIRLPGLKLFHCNIREMGFVTSIERLQLSDNYKQIPLITNSEEGSVSPGSTITFATEEYQNNDSVILEDEEAYLYWPLFFGRETLIINGEVVNGKTVNDIQNEPWYVEDY